MGFGLLGKFRKFGPRELGYYFGLSERFRKLGLGLSVGYWIAEMVFRIGFKCLRV